ncbi:hypothetical protein [Mycobacterium leprae]|nr:hypothetical protein [Mycobacterium leprae]
MTVWLGYLSRLVMLAGSMLANKASEQSYRVSITTSARSVS